MIILDFQVDENELAYTLQDPIEDEDLLYFVTSMFIMPLECVFLHLAFSPTYLIEGQQASYHLKALVDITVTTRSFFVYSKKFTS
jgi:hypothetical protein